MTLQSEGRKNIGMEGIILAGESGTRLYQLTANRLMATKQLSVGREEE